MRAALLFSLLFATPVFAQASVRWRAATPPIPSARAGDPALSSFILGSDTAQSGIYLYDLDGVPTGALQTGIVNSIDVRASLVAASSPNGGILLYSASTLGLTPETPASITAPSPGQLALGSLSDGGYTLWFDTSSPVLRHYDLPGGGAGFTPTALGDVQLPAVPTGLAYDDGAQQLYAALPGEGIVAVDDDGGLTTIVPFGGGALGTSLGGLGLLRNAGGLYFFSTAPSDDQVYVNLLQTDGGLVVVGNFLVTTPDGGAEAVRMPAYLDVADAVPGYPSGALLLHDGLNASYKLVALDDVAAVLPLAGIGDGGMPPGGGTGGGAASGISGGGGASMSGPSAAPEKFGCAGDPLVALPALLLLWWIRRPRS